MNHVLIIHKEAEDDMKEAYDAYESKNAGVGERFLGSCEHVFQKLLTYPLLGLMLLPDVRKLPTHDFPYSVYYRVRTNVIEVFGVIHQKRDSLHWKMRLDAISNGHQ